MVKLWSWRQEAAVPLLAQLMDPLTGTRRINTFHLCFSSEDFKLLRQHSPFILTAAKESNTPVRGKNESLHHLVVPLLSQTAKMPS